MKPEICPLSVKQEIRGKTYRFCQYDMSVSCDIKSYETCPVFEQYMNCKSLLPFKLSLEETIEVAI